MTSNDCCILTLQMLEYNLKVTVPVEFQIQTWFSREKTCSTAAEDGCRSKIFLTTAHQSGRL